MIKILYFASLKEKTKLESEQMEAAGKTIAELRTLLMDRHPIKLDRVMIAVNEEFTDEETVLNDGDTVDFIPPVSGG